MSSLAQPVAADDNTFITDTPISVSSAYPWRYTVDSEVVYITGASGTRLSVLRGCDDTTRANHAQGATLTAAAIPTSGGGGSQTLAQTLVNGNTTGEHAIATPAGMIDGTSATVTANSGLTIASEDGSGNVALVVAGTTGQGPTDSSDLLHVIDSGGETRLNVDSSGNVRATFNDAAGAYAEFFADVSGGSVQIGGADMHVAITTGNGPSGDLPGGDVSISLGTGAGAGRQGLFIVALLPSSDPGVAGALYTGAAGALFVSAG